LRSTFSPTYNVTEDFYDRLRSKAKSQAELLLKVQVPLINSEVLKALDETNRDLIYDENIFIFDEKNRLIYSNTASQSKALHVSNYWLDEIRKAGQIRYNDGDYKVVGLYYKYPFNRAVVMLGAKDLYGQANLLQPEYAAHCAVFYRNDHCCAGRLDFLQKSITSDLQGNECRGRNFATKTGHTTGSSQPERRDRTPHDYIQ
jgi:hypothetical protein